MLNETNSFGRLVWTISGKMSSFLANETTVMFLFSEVSLVLHWYQSHTSFCGGLPVIARIALLDTRFKEYQHALVGTILTTLHAGNVLLTFYPNFNLSLEDPNLPTTLKVQIQLQGAEQTPTSKIATLHHQIMYRLQNHALDLPTPYTTSDALMILADTNTIPTIIQIPKQIQKQDLLQLMPLEWLTNYEHFHQNSKLVQTTEAIFDRRPNGQVKLSFQTPDSKPISDSPQLSYTAMITAAQTGQEKKLPIHGFSSEGYPVYPDKINGHFLWDVPEAHMCNPDCPCLDDTDIDEELEVMRRKTKKKKKASYPASSCKSFAPQPPPNPKPPVQPIRSCLMFSTTGQPEEPKQHEAVLNWQTKNANAQNHTLHQLDKKIDHVATQVSQTETKVDSINSRLEQMYIHLQDQIFELDADLRRMINNHIWGPEFNKKEAKIRKLKAELSRIDAEKTRPSLFTQPQPTPVSPPIFDTYASFYTTSRPQQHVYNQFFGFSHLQPTPQPSSPKKSRSKVKISEPRPKATSSSSTSTIPLEESQQDIPKPLKKDKSPMDQFHYHTVQTESSDSSDSSEPETNNSSSSSSYDTSQASIDSESEYADITSILMATETTDPSASTSTPIVDDNPSDQASQTNPVPPPVHDHSTKPSSISWFTFDDIPRHKWAARLQEFAAWIDLQGTKPNAQPQAVLREFMARSIDRKEYHQMKCCSLKRHLLDAHYKRMSILFYKLNGFNEPSLKHVFIASLPPELQPDLQRKLTVTNLSIADISLGKIFQMAMLSLDKICEQKEFFKDLMGDKKPFSEACKKPHLKMECKDEKKPSLKMSILPSKFHKPIPVIGFLDTGADTSMIDPSVLPSDCWEHHSKLFRAVNGEIFKTTLITKKPIVKNLFLTNSGVRYKQMFLPYTNTLRLYTLSETQSPYSQISQKLLEFCPENHSQFHHPAPLWKNEQFFIHLPFKLNEDINPTKASHPGMSPSDLLLAKQECSQLLQQGLIKSTDSDWACQAFYVEKQSELVHGKKRLVIDYQPLNSFLKDDKFPLPKIQTLFVHLQGARIFSKFDLKAGFWQLGILPVDHHKNAFCIPDAHYQWTVMPFGLKVTPSLFQKAMTKIFCPILHHALVYIDDILLFSSDHESHQKLLLDFFHIVQAHGIMLSEKKSSTGKESIDFLGMVIKAGQYQPVAIHTSQLSHMLKKQCPPWGPAQTEAVKQLKTDASNDYWSAILLEAINGLRHFCAHASGQFKDSIYKEILAVKYGIKKFEFHLISHKFLINMDNSSFPRIFDFKNKLPLDKQLLSLKTWFAKYDFTVQHIKGNQNLIPDFLTRPALISSIQTIPVIAMNRQLPFKALNQRNFPMNISFQLPYQLQDFVKKFLYRFFFNVQTKKPNRFPNLCMEHLFLIGLTLSSLSISEDELWYMWCLTTLYATKLVFPIKPVLTHLTTPEFSPDLLWTLFEWYSPLTWWRQQLHHLYTFHGLDKMPKQEANMWTIAFIVHRPYFQHPETRDYWTQDMAYEGKTYPHPYTFIHDTVVTSVLKAYLMELNNVPPPATNIHHTSIGPSHTLEIIPKTQGCTPDSPAASTPQHMSEANEEKYQQTEAYLDQRQRRQHKRQYETETGDVSPSRYPSTP
ncbi:hypothetical protein KPL70_007559 [Citrus sinensis]|nr:hypothetical protein KPL70_007559 [Citrus sinensis]